MNNDVIKVIRLIETQLGSFEQKLSDAKIRINKIENDLNKRIKQVRVQIEKLADKKDYNMLVRIADMLNEIDNIVDKLNNIEISPSGIHEVSLDSLVDEEYDKMELFVF